MTLTNKLIKTVGIAGAIYGLGCLVDAEMYEGFQAKQMRKELSTHRIVREPSVYQSVREWTAQKYMNKFYPNADLISVPSEQADDSTFVDKIVTNSKLVTDNSGTKSLAGILLVGLVGIYAFMRGKKPSLFS